MHGVGKEEKEEERKGAELYIPINLDCKLILVYCGASVILSIFIYMLFYLYALLFYCIDVVFHSALLIL